MDFKKNIQDVINKEVSGLKTTSECIDDNYEKFIQMVLSMQGKLLVTGVGKSGIIAKKIAATFSSTGTPCFFFHSTEGVHGDLGMVEEGDVVIAISNSGETAEVLALLPSIKQIGAHLVAMTSNDNSTLAKYSEIVLTYHYESEADQLNLAPTTSSVICLAIGDALACTVSQQRCFTAKDFHLFHPGGNLGKVLEEQYT